MGDKLIWRGRLPPHKNARGSYLQKRMFIRELHFMSFIAHKVLSLKKLDMYPKTTFTKITTNYVEDWIEIVGSRYIPQAEYVPHPFGMVSYISVALFRQENNDNHNRIFPFVYQLRKIPQNLWEIEEIGEHTFYKPIMGIDELEESLSDVESVSVPFTYPQIDDAKCLSRIYKELTPVELNVLASHRDHVKTKNCFRYVCGAWSKKFGTILETLKDEGDGKLIEEAKYCIKLCNQIEVKTNFIKNKVPDLINKLEDIHNKYKKDRSGAFLKQLIKHITENAYIYGSRDKRAEDYFTALKEKYKIFRSTICPLTRALLDIVNDLSQGKELNLHTIPSPSKRTVMDIEYEEKNIKQDIVEIKGVYDDLKEEEPDFRPMDLNMPLDIGDGSFEEKKKLWQ